MLAWLDKIPYPAFILVALAFLAAPVYPEPHAWEKLKMLFAGTLKKPIDIFDLFLHTTPTILLCVKAIRDFAK
ncbi:MAG: RND transporter [Desulfovibrio sp.]|nr:MAG: RND transporter [Desulfovibrio sp.]